MAAGGHQRLFATDRFIADNAACLNRPLSGLIRKLIQWQLIAHAKKLLVDLYVCADVIRVVLDNSSTHKIGALYPAFPPEQAHALVKKRQFYYPPQPGKWLYIAEIEFAVQADLCLNQRIANEETLKRVIAANVAVRNLQAHPVKWNFTTSDAR